jgi:hypothetical protein
MTGHNGTGSGLTRSGLESSPHSEESRAAAATLASEEAETPLVRVRRSETIADRVDFDAVRRELPSGWDVRPDLVQFGPEPLAETVRFRRTIGDPQLVLKPVDPAAPADAIQFFERSGPGRSRTPTTTVEQLPEALRVAINRIHQLDG